MPEQNSTILIAKMLRTLGHPLRVRLVELLAEKKELSVQELCELLSIDQSLMSHHLLFMKAKGLLNSRRDGKNVFYSIKQNIAVELIRSLRKM